MELEMVKKIRETLAKFVLDDVIISYTENYHSHLSKVYVTIIFKYQNKVLDLKLKINLKEYSDDTIWTNVLENFIDSRKKGEENESRIYNLLLYWKKKHRYGIFQVYRASEWHDKTVKADIIVMLNNTLVSNESLQQKTQSSMLYLQVKSSDYYQNIHKGKNPWSPSLVVNKDKSDEELKNSFKRIVNSFSLVLEINILIQLLSRDFKKIKTLEVMRKEYFHELHR